MPRKPKCNRCGKRPAKQDNNNPKVFRKKCVVCILEERLLWANNDRKRLRDYLNKRDREHWQKINEEVKKRVEMKMGDIEVCRTENRKLKKEIRGLKTKPSHPMWLKIRGSGRICDEGCLKDFLIKIIPVAEMFDMQFKTNEGNKKKQFPISITIRKRSWDLNESYLKSFLEAIKDYPQFFNVEYGRYPGR